VLTPRKLNSWRRGAIVVIAVVAAVITPSGDPISMIALAVPMYLFYELSILVGWLLTRKKRKAEKAAAAT
jgi:sec-independent protein translocase protein TatC